ncbi:MAG: acetyl-CoA hydrolase/transferase family protein [Lentihominibacter sp.]|jgi:succinyl-CoA:acetate CoA-transferase
MKHKNEKELKERIRNKDLFEKIISAKEAASIIRNDTAVGVSGFTPSGYPKAVPHELAERAKTGEQIKIDLYSGASVGPEIDTELTEAGVIERRYPYQTNTTLRNAINSGEISYSDMHISMFPQYLHYNYLKPIDVAITEALAITEEGNIVPTTGIGATPTLVKMAKKVIVEVNLNAPLKLEGMADIYMLDNPPNRQPVAITNVADRIGKPYIECGLDKIAAIVITDAMDKTRSFKDVDDDSKRISEHILRFLDKEVDAGRLGQSLAPLQSGVGSIANAVMYGLCDSKYNNLTCYAEVIQDSMLELMRCGKMNVASATSLSPSPNALLRFKEEIDFFRDKIILRPQEVSNNPEISRRLGVIAINTALEADIYGNINSTHIMGTKMMNGIGGSGDFAKSSAITIFSTPSTAKGGSISSIVPMVSHVDHTEHETMVLVTEQGYADLRGLSPRERAIKIIENCAHPDYKDMLMDYYYRACNNVGGQTPHIIGEALSWHDRYIKTGTMKNC